MVAIESDDLAQRLHYIIVGIEVAKTALGEIESEALDELNREYLEANEAQDKELAEELKKVRKAPSKKRSRPKKVKK